MIPPPVPEFVRQHKMATGAARLLYEAVMAKAANQKVN
jgi:hypothetical protein